MSSGCPEDAPPRGATRALDWSRCSTAAAAATIANEELVACRNGDALDDGSRIRAVPPPPSASKGLMDGGDCGGDCGIPEEVGGRGARAVASSSAVAGDEIS